MEILRNTNDLNIVIGSDNHFKNDAGWDDSFKEFETDALKQIINPVDNYETVRYIHKPYISNRGVNQTDIWFYFYFVDAASGYTNGMDYELVGITAQENENLLKQSTESFFRLEFFKTPNNEIPDRTNRRMVFAKNLSLPLGEKYLYSVLNGYIHLPVFMGSNYKNKENMYLFWFHDDSAFDETTLTGNTFWMTAKFYNAKDGSILDFTTTGLTSTQQVVESRDMYYKMEIDRSDYSYQIYRYISGVTGTRIGESDDPITFYEKRT
jgi:hypothetical protein